MEEGIVKRIISENRAEIILDKEYDCNTCSAKNNCFKNSKPNEITVFYRGELSENDRVIIELTSKLKIKLYFLIFFVPLVFLIIFYYISSLFTKNEMILILATILGLFLSAIIVWIIIRAFNLNNFFPEARKKD